MSNSVLIILQSFKPKSGVFCFLIHEARETTALEMPDHENTFVLKVLNYSILPNYSKVDNFYF